MNIVIGICIAYMTALLIACIVKLTASSKADKLRFIKTFKYGKFALGYLALIPLFFIGFRYAGKAVDASVWLSIKSFVNAVILIFDYDSVAPLMEVNALYKAAMELGFTMALLNAVMFAISFAGQMLYNMGARFFTRTFAKRAVVIVGDGQPALDIMRSLEKSDMRAVIMRDVTPELRDEALLARASYMGLSSDDDLPKKLKGFMRRLSERQVYIIVACDDDATAFKHIKQINALMDEAGVKDMPLTDKHGVRAFVFGSRQNATTFLEYEESSGGLIEFVNRHELIALDFVEKYPLTAFMTSKQIDANTATLRPEVKPGIVMIGFGKFNETLFFTSVSNNQFMTLKEGKLTPSPVNYHIYDLSYPDGKLIKEDGSVYSESLHHSYRRYSQFIKSVKQEDYLPFIDPPAIVDFSETGTGHPAFWHDLYDRISDENGFNYIIISCGTDMDNVELAKKLCQQLSEWRLKSFNKIFVKVRDGKLAKEMSEDLAKFGIIVFGANSDTVYNAERIINVKMESLAKRRHLLYEVEADRAKREKAAEQDGEASDGAKAAGESDGAKNNDESDCRNALPDIPAQVENAARLAWYNDFTEAQRESNTYACLNLRTKLNLMGYDYAPYSADAKRREAERAEAKAIAEEFERAYQKDDPIVFAKAHNGVFDYYDVEYKNEYLCRPSVRFALAAQEHQRWCANMIACGIVPYSIEQIRRTKKGKDLKNRQHSNITTEEGLIQYRRIMSELSPGKTEESEDVIRYDYQLMDGLPWLLENCGYRLVKKDLAPKTSAEAQA